MMDLQARRFAEDFIFLEGPKWRDGYLWVSDVFDGCVYAISTDGRRRKVCSVDRPAGLGFLTDGTLIIVDQKTRRLLRLDGDKTSEYADLSNYATGHLNDFAVDAQGRIYVGNFGYDYDAAEPPKTTSLHRVDPDGTISVVAQNVDFPNGSVIVNGGRTLIVAETWVGRLTAFDLNDKGELSHRRIFAELGERQPDGICADSEGAIWVACFNTGEFLRVLDGGKVTHRLQFDGRAVSCVLGGMDGHKLFLSTYLGSIQDIASGLRKGTLFTLSVDVPAPV
jgi:sugar lactone lactonase YvrE